MKSAYTKDVVMFLSQCPEYQIRYYKKTDNTDAITNIILLHIFDKIQRSVIAIGCLSLSHP